MNAGMFSSQFCHSPPSPCRNSSGGPSPPVSISVDRAGRAISSVARQRRPVDRRSRSSRRRRRTSGPAASGRTRWRGAPRTCPMNPDTPLPYQRPCASRSTSTRRCTPTGTSSPRSPSAASASSCPTSTQYTWAIDAAASPSSCRPCVDETHRAEHVARRRAVPGRRRGDQRAGTTQGHFIHITSHRAVDAHAAHRASGWTRSASRTTSCYCSYDKITPLRGDRDRRADRRLAGQPDRAPSRSGCTAATHRAPLEPRHCTRMCISATGLAARWRSALEPVLS